MKNQFTLEPLEVGILPAFPLAKFLYQSDSTEGVLAPCISWLARSTTTQEMVLIDTGPPMQTDETSKLHERFDVRPEHRIDRVLNKRGIDPLEITTVVFTHLHFDHCSYAELLPNAQILVQKRELQYAVTPNDKQRIGYEVGYKNVFPSWMKYFDRINTLDGDTEVSPGFKILLLPGHTPASSGVIFETKNGRHAIVGDLVNQVENWEGANGRHIPPTLNSSVDECYSSFARLEKESDVVLASHDYRMFDRGIYGE